MQKSERDRLDWLLYVPLRALFRKFIIKHGFLVTQDELSRMAKDLAESATDDMFSYTKFNDKSPKTQPALFDSCARKEQV